MKIPKINISVKVTGAAKAEVKTITCAADAAEVFRFLLDDGTIEWTESAILLCLGANGGVIGYYKISSGGVAGVIVDTRVVFTVALNTPGTTKIMLAHNHPSGNLRPSQADIEITQRLAAAGNIIDIKLLDHLIITKAGYCSLQEEGHL